MDTRSSFVEQSKTSQELGGNRFGVILLSEGLGNLQDAYYYSKEALQTAVTVFEGAQFMVDHPSASEEHDRPERSVKDVAGHYENIAVIESEGRSHLMGELVLIEGEAYNWVRSQLQHALKYSQKYPNEDFIGLSINASGDAEETTIDEIIKIAPTPCQEKLVMAKEQGVNIVKMTKRIDSATSCDLVTRAGAGGRILQMLEQEKKMATKHKQADAPADGDHADKDQDIALIKSMLDKYIGDKQDKEDGKAIRQTAKAYKATGAKTSEEAYEAAAKHIKASKHMKQEEDEAKKKEAEKCQADETAKKEADEAKKKEEEANKKEAFPPKKDDEKKDDSEDEDEDKDDKKESKKKEEESEESEESEETKKREAALLGEIAGLKAKLSEKELASYIENKLKESGASRAATKKFRECLKNIKTQKEFDARFESFKLGYESSKRGESFTESNPEKTIVANQDSVISFADCAE